MTVWPGKDQAWWAAAEAAGCGRRGQCTVSTCDEVRYPTHQHYAKPWRPAGFLYTLGAVISVSKYLGLTLFSWFLWFCPPVLDGVCAFPSPPWAAVTLSTWGWIWGWYSCNIWNWMHFSDFPVFKRPLAPTCLTSCCSPGTFWWHYKLLTLIFTDTSGWIQATSKSPFLLCETLQHLHSYRTIMIKPWINYVTFETSRSTLLHFNWWRLQRNYQKLHWNLSITKSFITSFLKTWLQIKQDVLQRSI